MKNLAVDAVLIRFSDASWKWLTFFGPPCIENHFRRVVQTASVAGFSAIDEDETTLSEDLIMKRGRSASQPAIDCEID